MSKSFLNNLNHLRIAQVATLPAEPTQPFKIGQTVWIADPDASQHGQPATVVAFGPLFSMCVRWKDGSLGIWSTSDFTATTPDPVPQNCPLCGGVPTLTQYGTAWGADCECGLETPPRIGKKAATEIWNSIRVAKEGEK
jgi:hypothetical protein